MEGKGQELAKPRAIFTISWQRSSSLYWSCMCHLCILHGSEVTLFYEIPINRVRPNVIGVARLCARYLNRVSEVKFHVHSGTSETIKKAPFWKSVEARKIGLKSVQPQIIKLKTFFSRSAQKQRSKSNQNNLKNAFCIGLFAIQNDCVARSYRFLYRLRTQTIIRQKVNSQLTSTYTAMFPWDVSPDLSPARPRLTKMPLWMTGELGIVKERPT